MKVKAKNDLEIQTIRQIKQVKEWHLYASRKGSYYVYPLEILKQGLCEGFKGRLSDFYISVQPVVYYGDGYGEVRFPKDEMDRFGKLVLKRILSEPDFVRQVFVRFKRQAPVLWRSGDNLLAVDLADKKDALLKIKHFHKTYINSTFYSQVTWFGGRKALSDYLRAYLVKKAGKGLADGYLALLISPLKPSFDFRERQSLLKIAQKKAKGIDVAKDIKKHTKDFEWLAFDYNGPKIHTENDFLKKVNDLLKEDLEKETRKVKRYFSELYKEQNTLFKKLKIDKHYRRLFRDMQTMILQQDFKKEATTKAHLSVYRFLKNMAKQRGIESKTLFYLTPQEIEDFVLNNKLDKAGINRRKQFCLTVTTLRGTDVFTGRLARDLAKIIQSRDDFHNILKQKKLHCIKGEIASKGRIKAIVKIITDPKESFKMPKGAVLVTSMTTPAFMPIMKRSSAIITDEGGITCHAAIVSRELGIPCIIGTKIATKALKDGDMVEVDANKGIVKIIK